jgi:hypothetical protein
MNPVSGSCTGAKIFFPERGARTARPWRRQGILSAAMGRGAAPKNELHQRLGHFGRGRIFLRSYAPRGGVSTSGEELGEKYLNQAASWPGSAPLSI